MILRNMKNVINYFHFNYLRSFIFTQLLRVNYLMVSESIEYISRLVFERTGLYSNKIDWKFIKDQK